MQPRPDRLDVYYSSDLVGAVYDSAPLAFEYAPAWLGGPLRMTLAAIALQPGRQATPEVQAFFENLLPEGELRDYLAACAELIRRYSTQPAVDLRHLVRWVFFNLYVGNNDSHAKNLSIYSVPGQGVTLTPFYDLMCTRLYAGLSPEFAFAIGGEVRPGEMSAGHLVLMARQLSMQPRYLAQQARDMADRATEAIDQAAREITPTLTPSARAIAARLERFVAATTKHMLARITAAS